MDFAILNNRRLIRYAVVALGVAVLLAFFPPFHVRALNEAVQRSTAPAGFDPVTVAQRMWAHEMPAASARAIDANALAAALAADSNSAARLGRRTGLGGKYYYFVRGEGRVSSVDRAGVWLDIGASGAQVLLKTGPVFGNALRDAPGIFELDAHSSFDANALSVELNRIAETRVQPALLDRASIGARLRFVGCGEVEALNGKLLLKIIPITADNPS